MSFKQKIKQQHVKIMYGIIIRVSEKSLVDFIHIKYKQQQK